MTVRDELQARAQFEQRYGLAAAPAAVQIERRVIGGDWGANGYTTMAQADQLAMGLRRRCCTWPLRGRLKPRPPWKFR